MWVLPLPKRRLESIDNAYHQDFLTVTQPPKPGVKFSTVAWSEIRGRRVL